MLRFRACTLFFAATLALLTLSIGSAQAAEGGATLEARFETSKELLDAVGSSKQLDLIVPIMLAQMQSAMIKANPSLKKPLEESFSVVLKVFANRKVELISRIAKIYAETFTQQELEAAMRFFRSPVGLKWAHKAPELMKKGMVVGREWGLSLVPEIQRQLRQEMKKRGYNI